MVTNCGLQSGDSVSRVCNNRRLPLGLGTHCFGAWPRRLSATDLFEITHHNVVRQHQKHNILGNYKNVNTISSSYIARLRRWENSLPLDLGSRKNILVIPRREAAVGLQRDPDTATARATCDFSNQQLSCPLHPSLPHYSPVQSFADRSHSLPPAGRGQF